MVTQSKDPLPLDDENRLGGKAFPEDASSTEWDRHTTENRKLAEDWKTQIELAERRTETWEKRCERIVKRYRDERTGTSTSGVELDVPRRMNVLWSNIQTLKPSIYGKEPVPICERRFLDRDPTGRAASQILERALRFEMTESGFHDSVNQAVEDYLLVGRGTVWVRYKPLFGPATSLTDRGSDMISPDGEEYPDHHATPLKRDPELHDAELSNATDQEIKEKLLGSTVDIDYVHWKDFLTAKARFWKENEWVARRVYMSRQDLIDRFGEEIGKEVPLEMTPEVEPGAMGNRTTRAIPEDAKKGIVYEIWFKPQRKVFFVAKGYEFLLEEPKEDPLDLEGFWPCPKPLYATMTSDTLDPVPDYIEYQDQALEIDQLTNRIDSLIHALKVAGVYDASFKQLGRLLDEGHENELIPVPNWPVFAEKGGLPSAISFLPIKEIAEVLGQLFEARDKIKNDLYEITGIADIMRGQADPRETARAISTKGKWGTLRLQQRQTEVARFCRDIIKMMGEVISTHYPDKTLIDVSGIMYDEGIGPTAPKPPMPPTPTPPPQPPMSALPPPGGAPQLPPGPAGAPGMGPPPQGAPMGPSSPQPGAMAPSILTHMLAQHQYQQAMQLHGHLKMMAIQKAIGLLRQDKLRGFRVDIETDSTINDNAQEEKTARTEFMGALSGFIKESMQAVQAYPEMLPLLGKSILFTVRGFRVGRDLESSIEEFIDKAEQDVKKQEGQPKPPPPEQLKAQADMQLAQANIQVAQIKAQGDQARAQAEVQSQQIEAQAESANLQSRAQMQQVEMQIKVMEAQQRKQELDNKAAYEAAQHQAKLEIIKMELAAKQHELALQGRARYIDALSKQHEANLNAQDRIHESKTDAQDAEYQAKLKAHQNRLDAKKKFPNKNMPRPPEPPRHPINDEEAHEVHPMMPEARKAKDGKWYVPDRERPGKYLRVDMVPKK
jgi:hypothetical protein